MVNQSLAAAILALAAAPACATSANLVLNGGLDSNSSLGCDFNLSNTQFNAAMPHATAFGNSFDGIGEIDVFKGSCFGASGPQGGTTYVGLHALDRTYADAFSLTLSKALVAGATYTLELYAQGFDSIDGLDVGLSGLATGFGSDLTSMVVNSGSMAGWQYKTHTFTAAGGESFLTFRAGPSGIVHYVFLDSVSLVATTAVPEPASWGLMGLGIFCISAWRRLKPA